MLNKSDVADLKKTFQTVVQDELKPVNRRLDNIEAEFKPVNQRLANLEKRTVTIERNTRKISKDLEMVIGYFDENQVKLERRVKSIENHLEITPANN